MRDYWFALYQRKRFAFRASQDGSGAFLHLQLASKSNPNGSLMSMALHMLIKLAKCVGRKFQTQINFPWPGNGFYVLHLDRAAAEKGSSVIATQCPVRPRQRTRY
jgi:hypothetical protein